MPGIPCALVNFLNQKIPSVKPSFLGKVAFELISKDVADCLLYTSDAADEL